MVSASPQSADHDAWTERARSVTLEHELARRGIKLRRQSKGSKELVGPCPHCDGDDRFAVNTAKQIFNCRGCGAKGDVIDLVKFLDGCDFYAACTTLAGEPPKPNGKDFGAPPRQVCTATFDYHDESGTLLFKVRRLQYLEPDSSFVLKDGKPKKTFRQKQPDPNQPGQWINSVDGVRIVPYRLPELIEAITNDCFIVVVEGEAKADLLWSWNVPATCCAMGAGKWKSEHSEFLRGADVVILPDNDQPGRNHADSVGASLQEIAKSVRVLELPGLAAKQDIIDWAQQGGTVEKLHDLIAREAKPWTPHQTDGPAEAPPAATDESDHGFGERGGQANKPDIAFPLVPFKDIGVDLSRRNYSVKGLLPDRGIAVIWGPPKCYKSFWAMDVAFHIALDRMYRGRRIKQGAIVYIGLEGQKGLPGRKEAFARHHNIEDAPFYLITTRLNLAKDADKLVADIKTQLPPDIELRGVFIDTLNRSLVGSESSDEDMAAYLAGAGTIEQAFSCLVAIVHHCGIDATRPRGHTSLTGAVDVQLRVERIGDLLVTVTVELAKDIAEGAEIQSKLQLVELGLDPDGDMETSLIVLPADPASYPQANPKKRVRIGKGKRKLHDAITEIMIDGAKLITPRTGMSSVRAVKVVDVEAEFERRYVVSDADPAKAKHTKEMAFKRALDDLGEDFGTGAYDGADWIWTIKNERAMP